MATGAHTGGAISVIPENLDFSGEFDPVLVTAADRPDLDTLPPTPDPAADHQDPELARRRQDVELKHDRIRAYLDATEQDAVVLGRAGSVAWFSSGGDLGQDLGSDVSSVLFFINRTSRAVISDNVQSSRVFEEELAGLGFQLKERPWYNDPFRTVAELSHNKRVACDLGGSAGLPWRKDGDPLKNLRRQLTSLERQRLRELGRTLTLAVEATCRNFDRGEREADVAGHLAHRLHREGVTPVALRVASDDRLERYREATSKDAAIQRRATISVTGRRFGLCASVTRTVSFGPLDPEYARHHNLATMVNATYIFFSRPGLSVADVFRRGKRIYEKFNAPHEWTLDYQGVALGYSPRDLVLTPDCDLILEPNMALCWSPSVRSARCEDTVVVDERGYEVVTAAQNWPQLEVSVKGHAIMRPGVLVR
ncbi:Metallopeptidase family M24 [Aquisphaera giovannonii]|uniref:Metallopeptidase family M24 n=1 Tax=Aquisphaera giovannonii TaxID=406548 RepID=A0A5B9VZD2_9BACT|nr:M24 family metallopeptidase [Aquisphaera giovannonii]QEH33683.1 Metallopeptidase family M24 [Aquisphaera giovannonii]